MTPRWPVYDLRPAPAVVTGMSSATSGEAGATFDVLVVGAGPGGYTAALRAAELGAKVGLVERSAPGGTCLQRGCIPTKALLSAAGSLGLAREVAALCQARPPEGELDLAALVAWSREAVSRLQRSLTGLLERQGVQLISGEAVLEGREGTGWAVHIRHGDGRGQLLQAGALVLAPGSRPAVPPALQYDGRLVITSDEAIGLSRLPAAAAIVGGGAVGCEFATLLAQLGVQVTVIEALPRLLPAMEADLARHLQTLWGRRGITVYTGQKVVRLSKGGGRARLELSDGQVVEADLVLIAIGRRPATAGLRLERAGVACNQAGEIEVDSHMATSAPGIYAVGDATNAGWKLAHVAARQGVVAAENLAGRRTEMDYRAVPNVVYTEPEVASVGLTSEQAQAAGLSVAVGRYPFAGNGRAVAARRAEGFVKVLAEPGGGRLLGVHFIGPEVSELVSEATLAVQWGITVEQLVATIHPHPTLGEALVEAAAAAARQSAPAAGTPGARGVPARP